MKLKVLKYPVVMVTVAIMQLMLSWKPHVECAIYMWVSDIFVFAHQILTENVLYYVK